MKYNELTLSKQKTATRAGRGISAGRGKTAGRGTKGQGSRKSSIRAGFEGGQIPLFMRLPKLKGFKSHRSKPEAIYTGQLEQLKKPAIDTNVLFEAGLISSPYKNVKLLKKGDLSSKKVVQLQAASKSAIEMVEKAGGSFTLVARVARPTTKVTKTK
jgi:large subunit ribosomal protein L15